MPGKKDTMIKTVVEEEPKGKRPLGRLCLRWEDYVKRDIKAVNPAVNWREVAQDRERWKKNVWDGLKGRTPPPPKKLNYIYLIC